MFFGEFPEGSLCLRLRNGVDDGRVASSKSSLLREGVPVLVGQRRLNLRVEQIHKGADSPGAGDVFDTGGDSLTDDVERSLSGDLRTAGVSWRSESGQGDDKPRGYP